MFNTMEGPTTSQPPPDNTQDDEVQKLDLPEQLQKITPATELPQSLSRWNSNEEIAAILIAFDRHKEWLLVEARTRPPSGSLLLYNRKKVSFRRDGYCWKKRRDGKTNREDHMKLKVKGVECIYGSYVHSAILPTFHRRCYWLLQNPHVVLVHYLNVPNHPNNPKPNLMPILSGEMRKKEWTKEELVDQLRPMLASGRQGELHPDQDHTVEETLEAIFQLLVSAQDDMGRPKPLAIDTSHQHPVGAMAAATASTIMAHHGVVPLASEHPHVQDVGGKQEVGLFCLQQQSGQLGGCVSTMAHLQVSASALPDHHHHGVLQNQLPTTTATATAPVAASPVHLHHAAQHGWPSGTVGHDLQLPMATHLVQQGGAITTTPTTQAQMTLATYSHVQMAGSLPGQQSVPVTGESHIHPHILAHPSHNATGEVVQAPQGLIPGLSPADMFQGTNLHPAGAVPITTPSSIPQTVPHPHSFPNLLQPGGHPATGPQPSCHFQPQQQQPTATFVTTVISNSSVHTPNAGPLHMSPAGVKDSGHTLGSIASVVPFTTCTNSYVSTHQASQHPPVPRPSKDIPLFAANPLAQSGEANGCDGDVSEGGGGSGGGGVDAVGMVDNGDNCDTLDGSFSSLPSTDLNLDLFLDLQDLEDCAADLAAATSLSPPQFMYPSSPLSSVHLPLATSSPLGASQASPGHSEAGPVSLPDNANHITTVQGSYVHSTMTTLSNAQLPQQQMPDIKPVMSSVWPTSLTNAEIQIAQTLTQSLHTSTHTPMAQDVLTDSSKTTVNGYSAVCAVAHEQSQQLAVSTCSDLATQHSAAVSSVPSAPRHGGSAIERASAICDFSPEWAYTEGNTKILVAGPWCNPRAAYTCVFDGKHVPATLVQAGVLRCFTPAHGAGRVALQVAQDGVVISNSEVFEFRRHIQPQPSAAQLDSQLVTPGAQPVHCASQQTDWFDMNGHQLKQLLLERLGELERRFISGEKCSNQTLCMESQESQLLAHVESLTKQHWSSEHMYPKAGYGGLTLLHLTSALGYAKLISALIRWRSNNPSPALEYEVDAHSVDNHACTPLMWACAKGQIDAALTLYHWNGGPLRVCNKDGHLPLAVARQRGHHNLATQVEQLEQAHFKAPAPAPAKIRCQNRETQASSLRPDPDTRPQPMSPETIKVEQPERESAHGNLEQAMQTSQPATTSSHQSTAGHQGKLIRRFSEQVISPTSTITHHPLSKRYSVDLLTSDSTTQTTASNPSALSHMRDSTSEPRLPLKHDLEVRGHGQKAEFRGQGQEVPALNFVLEPDAVVTMDREMPGTDHAFLSPHSRGQLPMDTDEVSPRSDSPFIDVERVSSDDEQEKQEDSKHQMVTLANQIIAAMPERIKLSPSKGDEEDEGSSVRTRSESHSSSAPSQGSPRPSSSSFGDDSGISTPMTDSLAFEEYRYTDFGTPASSLSPDSTCLPSPYSPYSFALDSPPPTTAEFTEYFNAPATYMEKDFSQLTLSDQEQRKLYEAAKVIQNAYRHYRDKQQQQHQKEIEAAILIQSYYRRYKQYAYYKKMTQAAVLIQNQFRSYSAQKRKKNPGGSVQGSRRELERLKKGRNQSVIIQQRFRSHYQRKSLDGKDGSASVGMGAGDAPDSSPPPDESQQCQEANPSADGETTGNTAPAIDDPDEVDLTGE